MAKHKKLAGEVTALKSGYGFIVDEENTTRFFHAYHLTAGPDTFVELKVGDRVTFDPVQHVKGPRAVNVAVKNKEMRDEG